MKRHNNYYVYILKCSDESYYTGYTRNIETRIEQHQNGIGSKYTQNRLPVELVFIKKYRYYENVIKAEKRYKKLTRKRKEEIIKIFNEK